MHNSNRCIIEFHITAFVLQREVDLLKIRVDGLAVGPLKFVHHLYYLTENKKDHIHAKNLLRLKLHAILIERD